MTWLTPMAGLFLALATIPPLVALYFLKLRRLPKPIASTLLWRRSLEDIRANAPFQRLRMNLLLLLQLAILALLAFAIAQPQVDAGLTRGGKTVILIDNSASMNAIDMSETREKPKTRLEFAKELAKTKVEKLFAGGLFGGGSGDVMVIAFADRAEVKCPFSNSRAQILAAIDDIEPTDATTSIGEALALARAFTTTTDSKGEFQMSTPAALELFSDGNIDDLTEQSLRKDESLRYNMLGLPTANNAGVVAIAAERSPEAPDKIQVFSAVATGNAEEVSSDVQLAVNGTVVAITPEPITMPGTTVPASERRKQVIYKPFSQPRDAVIEVSLAREDDLAIDNAAAIAIAPAKRVRVALVGSQGFVLRSLLEGMALEGLVRMSVEEFEASWTSLGADAYDVYVLQDYTPSEGKKLPPGRYLSFAGRPIDAITPVEKKERLRVKSTVDDHPVFRFVTLDDLVVSEAESIVVDRSFDVLAEAAEGPLVVAYDQGGVRLLHVTFDPLNSNWPFLRSFVNFVPNAIEWLSASGEALALNGLQPGDTASFRIPADAKNIELELPDGTKSSIAPREPGQFAWGPIRRAGIYTLRWDEADREGRQEKRFTANLLSDKEGQIRPVEKLVLGEREVAGMGASVNARSSLWPLLLGVALLVVMLEWWIYQRRAGV
ncbi:MAG: BatA and WFA domain-containing protein [Phycisphaerae bacterium]|nr:BatA and WFA domain-containing protein [Phycisphaerae bacterium]